MISCALLMFLLGIALRAEAQTCQQTPQCNALLGSGQSAAKDQDYSRALRDFEAAYELVTDPVLLLNIGRAHYRLGNPNKAIENYLRFQGAVPNPELEIAQTFDRYMSEARAAQARATAEANPKKPLHKKWWFWTAIVGGLAVAATAIGLGVNKAVQDQTPMASEGAQIFHATF